MLKFSSKFLKISLKKYAWKFFKNVKLRKHFRFVFLKIKLFLKELSTKTFLEIMVGKSF
jgi:hypothetical protein